MLADLTGATDPKLRELARRLAGRLFLDVAKRGPARPRGTGKLTTQRYRPDGGDLDLDASLDAIMTARGSGSAVDPDDLRVRCVVDARHRDLSAGRPQRVDGRQAAGHQRRRRVGGRVASARRLLGAVVRQGRRGGEVPGRRQVERGGGRRRARAPRVRHDRRRRCAAGGAGSALAIDRRHARSPCCSPTVGRRSMATPSVRLPDSTSS